ncbi:MAG: hypothetical protein QW666_00165 [Candidatus Woesearchaeota archaeon]
MKTIFKILLGLLIMVLVAACAAIKEEGTPAKEEAVKTSIEVKEEVKEPAVAPVPTTTTPKPKTTTTPVPAETKPIVVQSKELSPELKDLLTKADRRVQSVVYTYAGPSTQGRFLDTYFVKGKYIKVDLYASDPYVIETYFDTVYLDTALQTATARCEEKRRCISTNVDNTKKIFNVSYADYRLKTPYEWIKDITFAEIIGPEVMEGRQVTKIKYSDARSSTEMWVDDAYGMPIKIVVTFDDGTKETYMFKDYKFNTLADSDVKPAFT